jgi:hypothetical protein
MITRDPDKKKELDEIPEADENDAAIYKIDDQDLSEKTEKPADANDIMSKKSKYRGTPQDLKDETSQD